MKSVIRAGTIFAFAVIVLAYFFRSTEDELQPRLEKVLSGLLAANTKEQAFNPRIAVGYGSCKDILFDGRQILLHEHLKNETTKDVEAIVTYNDLIHSYAHYFIHGAAAERFTPNVTLFDELTRNTVKISPQVTIGGNAATIARRFTIEGYNDVLLGTSITEESKKMLPKNLKIVGEVTIRDDVHLVFEYKAGEKWGSLSAPRANRFILHHDFHNPRLSSLKNFGIELTIYQPHLFVVSGLQMMDNYPMAVHIRDEILENVKQQMTSLPQSTKTHFEMASITDKELMLKILELVIPFSNSLGMNEQELANVYSLIKYKKVIRAVDSNPKVGKTLDMMRHIYSQLRENWNKTRSNRPLTRLHVHTLAYQLIMVTKDSGWKNMHVAAARASLVANTFVCDTKEVDIEKSMIVMDESFSASAKPGSKRIFINDNKPVTCWFENDYEICIAPNLICKNAKQTAGCGDNISAVGLAAQL